MVAMLDNKKGTNAQPLNDKLSDINSAPDTAPQKDICLISLVIRVNNCD